MRLTEQLAAHFQCKPKRPEPFLEFWPTPKSQYVTIYNDGSVPSSYYDYFTDVLEDIAHLLTNFGIPVFQIMNNGAQTIGYCNPLFDMTLPQIEYLIKNSAVHVATDPFTFEFAGVVNTPVVGLVGNKFADKPFFGKKHIVLEGRASEKPCFDAMEQPKSINQIKTEKVSAAILELLGIQASINYKTVFTGDFYPNNSIDVVPNFVMDHLEESFNPNLRLDKNFDLDIAQKNLSVNRYNIVTSEELPEYFLANNRTSIKEINFNLNPSSPSHIAEIAKKLSIPCTFFTCDEDGLPDIRASFIDDRVFLMKSDEPEELRKYGNGELLVKSGKLIFSDDKKFVSYAHLKEDLDASKENFYIKSVEFWEDQQYFKLIKRK